MYPTDEIGGFMYKDICRDSFWCLWSFINYGLRYGGGIGDVSMNDRDKVINENDTYIWRKQAFDLSFFFCVSILLLNMVAGIIIDTFAELREETVARSKFLFVN